MDYLKELLSKYENGENVDVVCTSDTFREFYYPNPKVSVWISNNVLYISK